MTHWRPGALRGVHGVAERVASKDLNNLYRTTCFLRDRERYEAFCAFYAVMRLVDDRVDGVAAREKLAPAVMKREKEVLTFWSDSVAAVLTGGALPRRHPALEGDADVGHVLAAFEEAAARFPIAAELWTNFFSAMRLDLEQRSFADFAAFLEYANGAAVAPATIYLYLVTAEYDRSKSRYDCLADFDLLRCGRELGIFAYLAHILRDLRDDLVADRGRHLYLSAADMAAHHVTLGALAADVAAGRAGAEVRALTQDLADRARAHAVRGRALLAPARARVTADRAFVLELIVRMYEAILDRIAWNSYDVLGNGHRLIAGEKAAIVRRLADEIEGDRATLA